MPTYQQFPLPDAGEGLTEAEIVAWHVAVGDTVEVNQTIVEIETAKSLVDLPSPWSGVVTRLLVEPGQTVERGDADHRGRHRPAGRSPGRGARRARAARRCDRARERPLQGRGETGTRAWSPRVRRDRGRSRDSRR